MLEKYEVQYDTRYCYPESDVLTNKLNIKDDALLLEAERKITAIRMIEASKKRIRGRFDFEHLKRIHFFIFRDVYDWAGQVRTVNISKGNQFCRVEFIEGQANELLEKLQQEHCLKGLQTKEEVSKRLAYYLGELNAIHPFREGNGRSQRMFVEHLAHSLGYKIDFGKINRDEMLKASIQAFDLEYSLLEKLLSGAMEKEQKRTKRHVR